MSTFLIFLFSSSFLLAQDTVLSDSTKTYIQDQIELEVKQQLGWIYWVFGIAATLLTVWAVVMWFHRIRKVAEQQIEEKAAALVEKKISEKVGVKTDLIRMYFQKIEKEQELFSKRILVINAETGKRQVLEDRLEKAGFKIKPVFWHLSQFQEWIDSNQYDLLLFDNEDGQLDESAIAAIIDKYSKAFKFVCYTKKNWSAANYQKYSSKLKFVKDVSYLGDAILNALRT